MNTYEVTDKSGKCITIEADRFKSSKGGVVFQKGNATSFKFIAIFNDPASIVLVEPNPVTAVSSALEIDPRLIEDPRIINEELQKEVAYIKARPKEQSDYQKAYDDLLFIAECTTKALTKFGARYQEASK